MKRYVLGLCCVVAIMGIMACGNNKADNTENNSGSIPAGTNGVTKDLINIPASAGGNTNGKLPKMAFADTNHDFGNINAGDKVTWVFKFKNTGEGDLLIQGATAGCSCTKPTYPEDIKHPSDTGSVSVTFDSSNKEGKVVKIITLTTNCQPPYKYLSITANIKPSNN
jgi:Protein of unknown function (DUF1573)